MKNDILFTAGVLLLVGSFAHLSVCQNQTERPGVAGLSDCTHRNEAVGKLAHLVIEHIEFAPGSGKATNPKIGTTFGEVITSGEVVNWKSAIVNGRPVTVITRDVGAEGCILRDDWDNMQASVHNEK